MVAIVSAEQADDLLAKLAVNKKAREKGAAIILGQIEQGATIPPELCIVLETDDPVRRTNPR